MKRYKEMQVLDGSRPLAFKSFLIGSKSTLKNFPSSAVAG